jgi:hypothetical protein
MRSTMSAPASALVPLVWYSVPSVCKILRVGADKVRGWIARDELKARNVADRPGGRPIWRISDEELNRFLRARQSAATPVIRRQRREKEEMAFFRHGEPVKFF